MQLSEDQVIRILINKYKREGKDLFYLFSDPVFNQMSFPSKVAFLKEKAEELSKGINPNVNKGDVAGLLADIALGALGSLFASSLALTSIKALGTPLDAMARTSTKGMLGLVGGLIGGAGHLMGTYAPPKKKAIIQELQAVIKNPTDEQTVHSMSNINSVGNASNSILNRVKDIIENSYRSNLSQLSNATYNINLEDLARQQGGL